MIWPGHARFGAGGGRGQFAEWGSIR